MKTSICRRLAAMLAVLALAGCSQPAEAPLEGARIGGPFALTAHDGRKVSDKEFNGRYRLVYFGYSYCPDICPTDLLHIGQGLAQFEKSDPARAAKVQPIFITIDPARDTPQILAKYVSAFHPRLIGLSGTPEEIAVVARSYGVAYAKQPSTGASEYLMDHSRQSMLFGPEGKPIALIPQDEGATAVFAELDRWVK